MTRLTSFSRVDDVTLEPSDGSLHDSQAIYDAVNAELGVLAGLRDRPVSLLAGEDNDDEDEIPPTQMPGIAKPPVRKTETSQQTPTQVNEDRDYTCERPPSSSAQGETQSETLRTNDTGAVDFGDLNELPRPSSQISEDGGFENTRGGWRMPDQLPEQFSNNTNAYTPYKALGAAPETPALPKNPFGVRNIIGAPLAGSQLFGQTQLLTSAAKISPTSSRPSPNIFLNSISPNLPQTSPLKNRTNVSSPTNIQTSSPQRLHDGPTSAVKYRGVPELDRTPRDGGHTRDDLIPESPTLQAARHSSSRQPMAHYEPMKKSQERKANVDVSRFDLILDSDSDDALQKRERQKKVERRRAQAAHEMKKVSFIRPTRRGSGEQPSRKKRRTTSEGEGMVVYSGETPDLDESGSKVAEVGLPASQKHPLPSLETQSLESTKATPCAEAVETTETPNGDSADGAVVNRRPSRDPTDEDMIPATSPIRSLSVGIQPCAPSASEPELPTLFETDQDVREEDEDDDDAILTKSRRIKTTYGRKIRQQRRNIVSSTPINSEAPLPQPKSGSNEITPRDVSVLSTASVSENAETAEVTVIPKTSGNSEEDNTEPDLPPRPASAPILRAQQHNQDPLTPMPARMATRSTDTSSSLTVLSKTPMPSSKTTPGTQESPSAKLPTSVSMPSTIVGGNLRKRALRHGAKSESPQPLKRAARTGTRSARLDSTSTDELQQSSQGPPVEASLIQHKPHRGFRQSLAAGHRACRLFENMVFAISMQADQAKQKQARSDLESKIAQAGGLVLQEGFQELFEPSTVLNSSGLVSDEEDLLTLAKASAECGFTAVIADGHSRKAKYMQALALGLPCLAYQWITACLSKGDIVDWEPYLLGAGSSPILGNAVRSRCLQPYPAADARLVDMIEQRRRLLQGQTMLAVVDSKTARSEMKKQYIFLAQALGPSIHRVSTTQQARQVLQDHEKAGRPFSWLYIDQSVGTVESVLSAVLETTTTTTTTTTMTAAAVTTTKTSTRGRKRKRPLPVVAAVVTTPLVKNIRVLYDELVIQSLILGRMVEEDEMNF